MSLANQPIFLSNQDVRPCTMGYKRGLSYTCDFIPEFQGRTDPSMRMGMHIILCVHTAWLQTHSMSQRKFTKDLCMCVFFASVAGAPNSLKLKTHYTCVCVCVCVHSLAYAYAFSINSPVLILRRFILCILCFDCDFL